MKKEVRLIRFYGINEAGLAALPHKVSGRQVSRICVGEEMGCSLCFPHGIDTSNSYLTKEQRNWKKYRRVQYR